MLFGWGDLESRMARIAPELASGPPEAGPACRARPRVYLHVGQLFSAAQPHAVTTILGSCVSVCLWDPRRGVGGLNHFLLPHQPEADAASTRFGRVAIERLIEQLIALGSGPGNLQAKLFGGACSLEPVTEGREPLGAQNVRLARHVLRASGIPVVATDVGGTQGRRLIFQTDDGSAWVRRL